MPIPWRFWESWATLRATEHPQSDISENTENEDLTISEDRSHSKKKDNLDEDAQLFTCSATHINVVTMVSKCIKQSDNSNFEPSSKLFDSNVSEVIDVFNLNEHLANAWEQEPLYTRKLFFLYGFYETTKMGISV